MEPVLPEKRLIRCNSWTDGNSPDGRNEMAGCFGNAKNPKYSEEFTLF